MMPVADDCFSGSMRGLHLPNSLSEKAGTPLAVFLPCAVWRCFEKEYAQAPKTGEQRVSALNWANRKITNLIDKLNLPGYNIPVVYTTGISGGINGTYRDSNEDPRSWEKEFLEKGFKDASLNKIVAEAGFTKGAFYGYYPDKAALFEDLVGEAAKGLLEQFKAAQAAHFDLVSEEKTKDSLKLSTEYLRVFVEYMYAHFDAFKLILCRAEGTRYANFLEEFAKFFNSGWKGLLRLE